MKLSLTIKFTIFFLASISTVTTLMAQSGAGPIYVPDRRGVNVKGGCYCTEYVAYRIRGAKNKYDFRNANLWGSRGSWLANNGYTKQSFSTSNLPQNKDVIIVYSGWKGIDPTYGHVAFVGSAFVQNGTITINAVGANQTLNVASKCGCNNESNWPLTGVQNNDSRIEIWRKSNPSLACP